MKNYFITLDGPDGGGKTTQAQLITGYLNAKGYKAIYTREPGGSHIAEKIRSIILDPTHIEMGNITELLLYEAARAQVMKEIIIPNLNDGFSVVCDRFTDSTYAYQGFARGHDLELIDQLNKIATDNISPDITFLLDIPPEIGMDRRLAERAADRLESEKLEFYQKVYEGYRDIAKKEPDRIKVINATKNIDTVFDNIRIHIEQMISGY